MFATRRTSTTRAGLADSDIGLALDRAAYGVLCVVVALVWAEATILDAWAGMLLFGIYLLRLVSLARIRRPSPLHYCMIAFVGWVVLSLLWTMDWASTAKRAETFVQLLLLAWMVWDLAPTERRVRGLVLAYVVGGAVTSALTLYNFAAGNTTARLAADRGVDQWETYRYSIAGLNENDLALMLALTIPMALYLQASRRDAVVKLVCVFQIVGGMTAVLLSGSRGGSAAAAVALIMYPLIFPRFSKVQKIISLASSAALLACGAYLVPDTSWRRIFELGTQISEGTMTHRTVIWAAGLEVFRNHALLGVGAGAYGFSILRAVDISYVAHNTFLSVLVELGVVGALLMLALLSAMFYSAIYMPYLESRLWITLLLTWIVGVSSLTWEYHKPTWLLFGLVAAHAYARREAVLNQAPHDSAGPASLRLRFPSKNSDPWSSAHEHETV